MCYEAFAVVVCGECVCVCVVVLFVVFVVACCVVFFSFRTGHAAPAMFSNSILFSHLPAKLIFKKTKQMLTG